MRVDTSGNVGIGTSSPGARLDVQAAQLAMNFQSTTSTNYVLMTLRNAGFNYLGVESSTGGSLFSGTAPYSAVFGTVSPYPVAFATNNTERMRIDSSGNVGIGTNSPGAVLHLNRSGSTDVYSYYQNGNGGIFLVGTNGATGEAFLYNGANKATVFHTNGTERARITSGGDLLVGKTASDVGTTGARITGSGTLVASTTSDTGLFVNRNTTDGTLVAFRQDNNDEGTISVSGTTVSYNSFAGSHWSQLQDGSKPEILRGTVMESIDELVQWPDEPATERLCRSKVSDTAGSKRVYGVFMDWDNEWTATNDMYVTAVGAFVCRVNAEITVQMGDLLESNGDGTARVQADDIIRSSTIGKVTSTIKTHEYDDGSYCVPTVLYCG